MRILVVEDDIKIASAVKKGLEILDYAVDMVHDSNDAYNYITNSKYDLVVLDRMLPGNYDGVELVKKLRSENINLPILMLTAKTTIGDRIEGLNAGADDYLVKPFSFDEMGARVKALLRRPQTFVSEVLQIDNLKLDTKKFTVRRGTKDIVLTNKEFYLLEYLMRHQGQIVNKEMIMSSLWNDDANVLPNTIEVYIASLRNKIDRPFKNKKDLINTVRGFGYKLG